jgi:hypothetical protein
MGWLTLRMASSFMADIAEIGWMKESERKKKHRNPKLNILADGGL